MRFSILSSLLCIALVTACGDRPSSLEDELEITTAPIALDDHLVFLNTGSDQAIMIDVSADDPASEVSRVDLPVQPVLMERRRGDDHNELLIVGVGRRATEDLDAAEASLTVLHASGETSVYKLTTNAFDEMRQSPDGRFVVLFRAEGGEQLLQNTNLIAIVDLELKPGDEGATHFHTLAAQPSGVVYSPRMTIGDDERSLAVVLMAAQVTIIDLEHLDRRVTTARLTNEPGRAINPIQVLFGPEAGRIFVRPDSANDIFSLKLTAREVEESRNDFATAIDILGIGTSPSDMALYEIDSKLHLLALSSGGKQATVVDVSTSRTTAIQLPVSVNRIETFTVGADGDATAHALLWQTGATQLLVLDLDQVEDRRERNLEQLPPLGEPIEKSLRLPGESETQIMFVHSTTGLSLLELQTREVAPFASSANLVDAIFDIEGGRIWVAPPNQPRVSFINLEGGATDEVLLDDDVASVVPLFNNNRLAIIHPGNAGHLSLVDVLQPNRSTLRTLEGFLLQGLVD